MDAVDDHRHHLVAQVWRVLEQKQNKVVAECPDALVGVAQARGRK
jgi:hypothetical protein